MIIYTILQLKNQRVAENKLVGKRRIYYDQHSNKTLLHSERDKTNTKLEEEKQHEFSEGEVLWSELSYKAMVEDHPAVGKRRMYYEQHGNKTLLCNG